jgi:hypothetical protein
MALLRVDRTWWGAPAEPDEVALVRVEAGPRGLGVAVDAPLHGDPPPASPPGRADGLWEHEVVELFVRGSGGGYAELEVGPHGHHLFLTFREERERTASHPLEVAWLPAHPGRWAAETTIPWTLLPPSPWTGNAHAIHGVGPDRRYLSWSPQVPDFHRLERHRPLDLTP